MTEVQNNQELIVLYFRHGGSVLSSLLAAFGLNLVVVAVLRGSVGTRYIVAVLLNLTTICHAGQRLYT